MSSARHFVYRYNDNAEADEVEFDREGEMPIPKQNSVIARRGSRWRVTSVQVETTETGSAALPIFRVFLQPA
jgi:predicted RecA/RadA family phage recombinase